MSDARGVIGALRPRRVKNTGRTRGRAAADSGAGTGAGRRPDVATHNVRHSGAIPQDTRRSSVVPRGIRRPGTAARTGSSPAPDLPTQGARRSGRTVRTGYPPIPDVKPRAARTPDATASPDAAAIESRLDTALGRSNIRATATQRRRLAEYVVLLAKWNRAYNLTAVRDPFAMIGRHVLDSLSALDFLAGERLLDAGTGAGLPGLVLAIARPDVRCTLLDPVRKKIRFCAHAAMTLGLENVEIASERLAAHRPPHCYSTVISRAALSIADLVAGALPILDTPGRIIAMKGPRPEAELDALDREGFEVRVEPVEAVEPVEDVEAGAGRPAATLVLIDRAGR